MFIVRRAQEVAPSPLSRRAGLSRHSSELRRKSDERGTMNPCYAKGLAAILLPLPEGEGWGEGEFRCLGPFGSWNVA